MPQNLYSKIINSINGYNCIKCNSSKILMLIDRKYHCGDCSHQITPKYLSEKLSMIYSFYVDQSMSQVAKDFQFSYNKVRRFYNQILDLITSESNFKISKNSSKIYIASTNKKNVPNFLHYDKMNLILITNENQARIITVKCDRNKIISDILSSIIDGKKIVVLEKSVKKMIQITFPELDVKIEQKPIKIIEEFNSKMEDKTIQNRGMTVKRRNVFEKEILFRILYTKDLYNKIISLSFYTEMYE
jgi:hypothetical protein